MKSIFSIAALALIGASSVNALVNFPVSADVNVRRCAKTSCPIVMKLDKGDILSVKCQTTGEKVSNGQISSSIWDETKSGYFVSDLYVRTGASGWSPKVPRCGGGSTPKPPPTTPGKPGSSIPSQIDRHGSWRGCSPVANPPLPAGGGGNAAGNTATMTVLASTPLAGVSTWEPLLTAEPGSPTDAAAKLAVALCRQPFAKHLNANQFGALVSFSYNLGEYVWTASSSRNWQINEALRAHKWSTAANTFPNYGSGMGAGLMCGLVKRRHWEATLFSHPTGTKAGC
ncbi:hypothetical protein BGZ76_004761 [Entomortierella beljakovae]|nr:hypothetical protein BGZ76_004761 [Entomortierella beljakovae]